MPPVCAGWASGLICAPAGFGKTVLMSECARLVPPGTRLVWLDLGGRACTVQALYGQLSDALGERTGKDDRSENGMLALLRQVRQPLWIMLDDYPRDYSPELDACIDMLLDMGPAHSYSVSPSDSCPTAGFCLAAPPKKI